MKNDESPIIGVPESDEFMWIIGSEEEEDVASGCCGCGCLIILLWIIFVVQWIL